MWITGIIYFLTGWASGRSVGNATELATLGLLEGLSYHFDLALQL